MNEMLEPQYEDSESGEAGIPALDVLKEIIGSDNPIIESLEEMQEQREKAEERRRQIYDSVTREIISLRDEAVKARQESGIEKEWNDAEDAYQGIDDANRAEMDVARTRKPVSDTGGSNRERPTTKSTVLPNITRGYVNAASARTADMLMPTDDRAFAVKPTPMPELMAEMDNEEEIILPNGEPAQKSTIVKMMMEEAENRAKKAQDQIDDWLVECNYSGEIRKVIDDCARLGTGIIKGPYPVKRRKVKWESLGNGMTVLAMSDDIKPASKRINPWYMYPDPACGENIHNGNYIFELDFITYKAIKDLFNVPGYLNNQLMEVLKEGPVKNSFYSQLYNKDKNHFDKGLYEVWYFTGCLNKEQIEASGCSCEGYEGESEMIPVTATIINDRLVRVVISPLDTGEFPYDFMPWSVREDMPWGRGIANQMSVPQRMLTAATRVLMDNAGKSANPFVVINRQYVTPADGDWNNLHGGKIFTLNGEFSEVDVQKAFMTIDVPSRQQELSAIIQYAQKLAEDVTGLPMLLQGQQGAAPDTVGGMTILMNNASAVMRRVAKSFDDYITEPHIRRYYNWLMQYSDDPEMHGDNMIDARGSSALIERDIQNQAIMQMGQLVLNPVFELSPKKWMEELLKSQRLDPKRFALSEEEKAAMAEQQQGQQQDPRMMIAQINQQTTLQKADMDNQTKMQIEQMRSEKDMQIAANDTQVKSQEIAADQQMGAYEMQFKADQADKDRQLELLLLNMQSQLKQQEIQGKQTMTLAQIKAMMEKASMEISSKNDLFTAERALKLMTGSGI